MEMIHMAVEVAAVVNFEKTEAQVVERAVDRLIEEDLVAVTGVEIMKTGRVLELKMLMIQPHGATGLVAADGVLMAVTS
jgi:hypothetical protein